MCVADVAVVGVGYSVEERADYIQLWLDLWL